MPAVRQNLSDHQEQQTATDRERLSVKIEGVALVPNARRETPSLCASQVSLPRLSDSNEARFLTIKSHPEPEVLAAYRHQQLSPKELADVESHLSTCSKCRETIAQLVRSEESVPNDNGHRK